MLRLNLSSQTLLPKCLQELYIPYLSPIVNELSNQAPDYQALDYMRLVSE